MNISLEWLSSQPFEIVGSGREARYNCPNCDDTTKHLYVNADRSLWYCFKCGKGGKVQYTQKLEPSLEDYAKLTPLEKAVAKNYPTYTLKQIKSLPANRIFEYVEIPEDFESPEEYNAREYLYKRGVTWDEIERYDIRLALDKSGPYKNSIIFPVYYNDGNVDYFVCRKYDNSKPKYVNAPWPKESTLFITTDKKYNGFNIIVEGILDALAVARLGYRGIALLGKSATSQQLNRLFRLVDNRNCMVYLDNDALTHAIQLKLQLSTLGIKVPLINHELDAAELYLEGPKTLEKVIEHARGN